MGMRKVVKIKYKDGSTHEVVLLSADTTTYNEIVLTYRDLDNNMKSGFTEIVNVDGKYYNNPDTQKWEYYVNRFNTVEDRRKSDALIESLPDIIELDIKQKEDKTRKKATNSVIEKKKEEGSKKSTRYIISVMYANRGESLVIKDGLDDLPPVFFTLESYESDIEIYKRIDINKTELEELLKDIDQKFEDRIDISFVPADLVFKLSSGNVYSITFASCDNQELFNEIGLCDEIKVDSSLHIQSGLYPDNLSSALHNELPIEIVKGDTILKIEANKKESVGKK